MNSPKEHSEDRRGLLCVLCAICGQNKPTADEEGTDVYEVCVQRHFDAAHALRGYQGRCENLHGHRYEVVACARKDDLNEIGLAFDFTELKRKLDQVLGDLDHRNLNEVPPFDERNPTAENIARFVFDALQDGLPKLRVSRVKVYESPDAWATYSPD